MNDLAVVKGKSRGGREVGTQVPTSYDELGTRIEAAIAQIGTDAAAAELSGVSTDTLANYKKLKTEPRLLPLLKIARAAGVSLDWLATGEGPMLIAERAVAAAPDDLVGIPVYDVQAAAGAGAVVPAHEEIIRVIYLRHEWVRRAVGLSPEQLAVIEVFGESMKPTINSGDLLLINTTVDRFVANSVYLVSLDEGLLMVKRVAEVKGGLRIYSDNASYPEEICPAFRGGREGADRRSRRVAWEPILNRVSEGEHNEDYYAGDRHPVSYGRLRETAHGRRRLLRIKRGRGSNGRQR